MPDSIGLYSSIDSQGSHLMCENLNFPNEKLLLTSVVYVFIYG